MPTKEQIQLSRQILAKRIRRLRHRKGLTRQRLARRIQERYRGRFRPKLKDVVQMICTVESGVAMIDPDEFAIVMCGLGEDPGDELKRFMRSWNKLIASPRSHAAIQSYEWLTDAIAAGRDSSSIKLIGDAMGGLGILLKKQSYAEVDSILRIVPLESISPEIMLALARISLAAKDKLTEWKGFVQAIRLELTRRGARSRQIHART